MCPDQPSAPDEHLASGRMRWTGGEHAQQGGEKEEGNNGPRERLFLPLHFIRNHPYVEGTLPLL